MSEAASGISGMYDSPTITPELARIIGYGFWRGRNPYARRKPREKEAALKAVEAPSSKPLPATITETLIAREQKIDAVAGARLFGFTGDSCDSCGSLQMVRNGTCLKCNDCGATTGCS
ncbi:MAG: hypothetical protein ACM31O_03695 [Bacteroidota bacterium]